MNEEIEQTDPLLEEAKNEEQELLTKATEEAAVRHLQNRVVQLSMRVKELEREQNHQEPRLVEDVPEDASEDIFS